jgi:hypothetical protein
LAYPGHDLIFPKQTPAEERLMDYFWPANCAGAPPEYFTESVELLRTVKHREAEVVARLRGYLTFVQDAEVRNEIETFIHTLEEKQVAKTKKTEKKR